MPKLDKNKVLTESVKHLFNTIGPEDILRIEQGTWYFQNKPLTTSEVKQLKDEANILRQMKLWKVFSIDVKYQANITMFEKSKTIDDLVAGKLLLYLWDILKTRIDKLK